MFITSLNTLGDELKHFLLCESNLWCQLEAKLGSRYLKEEYNTPYIVLNKKNLCQNTRNLKYYTRTLIFRILIILRVGSLQNDEPSSLE